MTVNQEKKIDMNQFKRFAKLYSEISDDERIVIDSTLMAFVIKRRMDNGLPTDLSTNSAAQGKGKGLAASKKHWKGCG